MKKPIIILVLILVAVYAALSILGSGGDYAAERLLYKIMKNGSKITSNPDVAPPAQLAAIESDLKALIKKYPTTKTARIANIGLMEFYITSKKYNEAMVLAAVINRNYGQDAAIVSTAQFLKGVAYERMNKWNKALEEFRILKEKYPNTQLGMEIPIYIGKYYDSKGLDREAKEAYRDAAAFYSKMEREYSGKMLGYTASILLLQSYLNMRDYGSAGNALEDTLKKYYSPLALNQLLPLVEPIFIQDLKNPQKAIEIYKYLMSKTKNTRFIKVLERRIKKIESVK